MRFRFDENQIREVGGRIARAARKRAKGLLVHRLAQLADAMWEDMRENAAFHNHTHNLRSSLCALVFVDGREEYLSAARHGPGDEGLAEGLRIARANIPPGHGIMLVAGMGYAWAVEHMHGKWVISGTARRLEEMLKEAVGF